MTDAHEITETLEVDYNIPEHKDRTETALYRKTRETLFHFTPPVIFHNDPGRCFICGKNEEELGAPLQSHHFGIERCFAEGPIDWELVKRDFPAFKWGQFSPDRPYDFVDNMAAQGLLLCEEHHIGKDTGIHYLPFSIWLMQRYLKPGYKFSNGEIIEHAEEQ